MSEPDCELMAKGVKYGLTCGFWSDSFEDLDAHVLRHHTTGWEVFDVEGPR